VNGRLSRSGWLVAVAVLVFAVAGSGQQGGIPDAPSASKPASQLPTAPAPQPPKNLPPPETPLPGESTPPPPANTAPPTTDNPNPAGETDEEPRPALNIKTVPEGGATQDANTAQHEELYRITTNVNQVLVPVMVKDDSGRLVSGLLPKDFSVLEDGVKQKLNFFTSDAFALSAAVVLDLGMPDVAVQKVNKTFGALEGAFGQYDEVSVFTYSSTYSKQLDFSAANRQLDATLKSLKSATGRNNGVPVTSGPLGPQGPTINNIPVNPNASIITPPPKEAHVLNDAILAAAHDLAKRDRTRRKIIFVISDGKETGSTASYADVLKVLLSNNVLVYGVAVDSAALPVYSKLQKLKVPGLNYTANILPKYANATGGEIFTELSQNAIEDAYARAIGDARNQYTLGYVTRSTPSSKYRQVEVRVGRPGCRSSNLRPCVDVSAKDGYYPLPSGR
jgi:VWFA-related protein